MFAKIPLLILVVLVVAVIPPHTRLVCLLNCDALRTAADALRCLVDKQWKKEQVWPFFVVFVQLIHRLTQTDIRCTTMARLFFFPLLVG